MFTLDGFMGYNMNWIPLSLFQRVDFLKGLIYWLVLGPPRDEWVMGGDNDEGGVVKM